MTVIVTIVRTRLIQIATRIATIIITYMIRITTKIITISCFLVVELSITIVTIDLNHNNSLNKNHNSYHSGDHEHGSIIMLRSARPDFVTVR